MQGYRLRGGSRMGNPKSVLHGTIFSEEYWFSVPFFMKYIELERKTYPDMDTLVLTNNVPKESVAKLTEAVKEYKSVKIKDLGKIPNPRIGRINMHAIVGSRNEMFKAGIDGSYDVLYSVDFDTIPDMNSVPKLIQYFDMPKVGLVGGNYHLKGSRSVLGGPVICGKFPVEDEKLKEICKDNWTDIVLGLGFGFTMFSREIFSNPLYHCDTEFLKEHPGGTEDFPVCRRILSNGYRLVWVKNVRAKHLLYNKELRIVEAW